MGWWEISSERDIDEPCYGGDGPADTMGSALDAIALQYRQAWGRWPYVEELRACFNFVLHRPDSEQYIPDDSLDSLATKAPLQVVEKQAAASSSSLKLSELKVGDKLCYPPEHGKPAGWGKVVRIADHIGTHMGVKFVWIYLDGSHGVWASHRLGVELDLALPVEGE